MKLGYLMLGLCLVSSLDAQSRNNLLPMHIDDGTIRADALQWNVSGTDTSEVVALVWPNMTFIMTCSITRVPHTLLVMNDPLIVNSGPRVYTKLVAGVANPVWISFVYEGSQVTDMLFSRTEHPNIAQADENWTATIINRFKNVKSLMIRATVTTNYVVSNLVKLPRSTPDVLKHMYTVCKATPQSTGIPKLKPFPTVSDSLNPSKASLVGDRGI